MPKARLVISAVVLEKRPVGEVARQYGVARFWIYELLARYRTEGEAAFEPRWRRPTTSPAATDPATVELILRLRRMLAGQGLDAGADTIGWHLTGQQSPSVVGRQSAGSALTQTSIDSRLVDRLTGCRSIWSWSSPTNCPPM